MFNFHVHVFIGVFVHAQSCPTLWDPMDCSPPGSSVHGILQKRILEWVAILFSRGSSWPRDKIQVSCIADRRFTLWAIREAQDPLYSDLFPLSVLSYINIGICSFVLILLLVLTQCITLRLFLSSAVTMSNMSSLSNMLTMGSITKAIWMNTMQL